MIRTHCWVHWEFAAKPASCCTAMTVWKACLVLLACDASKRTTQHMQDTCRGVIPCAVMPLKGEDLRMLTPKPAAVFAVTDENLAHLCAGYLKKQVKEDSANG